MDTDRMYLGVFFFTLYGLENELCPQLLAIFIFLRSASTTDLKRGIEVRM